MAKLQDILSGLKSFAKSDTGKTLGMAVGTIAAGRYGGAEGINALSSVIKKNRLEEERKKKEEEDRLIREENRDLRKLQRTKAELDIKKAEAELNAVKPEKQSQQDWTLMNTRAVEPDETSAGVKAAVSRVKTEKEPKLPQPPAPTPVSIDDPEAVQKGEIDAAKWAAKTVQAMGLMGAGKQAWDKNKFSLDSELRNTGLTKEQQAAAWKEMSRLIMPGRYEQIQEEMAKFADPDYTSDESNARFQEGAFKSAGTAGGAMLGASMGTGILPGIGTIAGGLIGAGMGYAGSRALSDVTFTGQADAVSTPAVAGANKSAAEDMATYQDDNRYAMQIARGLERTGLGSKDTDQIMAQLEQIPEIGNNKERRDKVLRLVKWHLSQSPESASQWMNQRAWR
jgi:hypothetical protein